MCDCVCFIVRVVFVCADVYDMRMIDINWNKILQIIHTYKFSYHIPVNSICLCHAKNIATD